MTVALPLSAGSARMVEERVKAGAKALSDWIKRCRIAVGELGGENICETIGSVGRFSAVIWGRSVG